MRGSAADAIFFVNGISGSQSQSRELALIYSNRELKRNFILTIRSVACLIQLPLKIYSDRIHHKNRKVIQVQHNNITGSLIAKEQFPSGNRRIEI